MQILPLFIPAVHALANAFDPEIQPRPPAKIPAERVNLAQEFGYAVISDSDQFCAHLYVDWRVRILVLYNDQTRPQKLVQSTKVKKLSAETMECSCRDARPRPWPVFDRGLDAEWRRRYDRTWFTEVEESIGSWIMRCPWGKGVQIRFRTNSIGLTDTWGECIELEILDTEEKEALHITTGSKKIVREETIHWPRDERIALGAIERSSKAICKDRN